MATRLTLCMRLLAITVLLMGTRLAAQNADSEKLVLAASGQVILRDLPVTQVLHISREMRPKVEHRGAAERVYLVLQRPTADLPPGIAFDVFLDLPPGKHGDAMSKYLIGNMNFYEMRPRSFLSFDITDRIQENREQANQFKVTLIPDGKPAPGSHIHIDRIELVLLTKAEIPDK